MNRYMVSKYNTVANKRCFALIVNESDKFQANKGTSDGAGYESVSTWGQITNTPTFSGYGSWYFVCARYSEEGATRRLTIDAWDDGKSRWMTSSGSIGQDYLDATSNIGISDSSFTIGERDGSSNVGMPGYYDEVIVFNKVLDDTEVAEIRDGTYTY
jgi:hypothetical protein